MIINEFISNFKNHPVMFIGTGLSLRYLENSYSWDDLLKKIALDFTDDIEYYLDLKSDSMKDGICCYDKVATALELDFNNYLKKHRHGVFEEINNDFYAEMANGVSISRFKLYISHLFKELHIKKSVEDEITELKKARKNISSIITTNYDCLIEDIFEFDPLIGNDILLSNPYGSVYKIHGCVTEPKKIIITESDYKDFDQKYELIRAQLLSIFIHNPIIFIGYNIGDQNIKTILKTIFTYVSPNSDQAQKIRDNFLLVEYEKNSLNHEVFEHDIDIEGFPTIRINKLKTDDFSTLYKALSMLQLPVSAMDIRKVQSVVRDIYTGGNIKVSITSDLDSLKNGEKVLVIGAKNTIKYEFQTTSEMMANYFKIIDESNSQLLSLINKQRIQSTQYFPVFGFSKIFDSISRIEELKNQQKEKVLAIKDTAPASCHGTHTTPEEVLKDYTISQTYKAQEIICSILTGKMCLESTKNYLINYSDKKTTDYRRILCAYDYKKYGCNDKGKKTLKRKK